MAPSPTTTNTAVPPSPVTTATATHVPTPTPCGRPGTVETGTYHSQIAGQSHYRIYLPPCYGLDGRLYPTLYMLPGNVHTDAIWDELGLDETAESAITNEEIPPLLIVMPDGGPIANNTSGGPASYEGVILNDLIPFVQTSYCAWNDPAGRAIGGLSRGGYWALEIAFRHPDQFASVGGHSAALLDVAAGPDLNPQHTGLGNDLGDLRIYLDIGRDDYVIYNVRRLHEEMETAGIPHTWVLNDGRHEEAYWGDHLADYLHWYTFPWPPDRDTYPPCQGQP
jgi:enterochelin esterase-like enzyme